MSEFGKAFRAARASGKKVFTWNGKSYTTKLKSEAGSSKTPASVKNPKNVPTPTPRPSDDSDTSDADSSPKKPDGPQQDYPRPAKDVGIAKAKSPIGQAAAKRDNAPVDPDYGSTGMSKELVRDYLNKRSAEGQLPGDDDSPPQQGPKPEGVWYAKKGSAMSKAAARRANAPVAKN